ncbi:MAG: sensor domain-containing diguanylate cyclase, partial [Candidatus Omnitrophica bacterium]|nr:sensor domain-containing diguanylate cyclase [Candidatus Omnitrophota bacterium]
KLNLEDVRNDHAHQTNFALYGKKERYRRLSDILEGVNQKLDIQHLVSRMAAKIFSLIAGGKGVCAVYLVDAQTQRLSLCHSRRQNEDEVIKAKEGDTFDWWVMRHVQPLIVPDAAGDFRFDSAIAKKSGGREFSCLISSPLISGNRLLGLVRLDSPQAQFYTQDDLRFLATVCDLAAVAIENCQLYARAQELAIRDELTSLYTKHYFLERLQEECRRSARQRTTFGLLMLDIDFFKKYNDSFGHSMGDRVLKSLAALMRKELAAYEPVIGRFGGEEFSVILPGCGRRDAGKAAEKLRAAVAATPINLRRQNTQVTVSIGAAFFPDHALDEETLIREADKNLYAAKREGRNRVCFR